MENIISLLGRLRDVASNLRLPPEQSEAVMEAMVTIGVLYGALRPFSAIDPVILDAESDPPREAQCYWTVIGHPNKCHFTLEDIRRAKEAIGGTAVDEDIIRTAAGIDDG